MHRDIWVHGIAPGLSRTAAARLSMCATWLAECAPPPRLDTRPTPAELLAWLRAPPGAAAAEARSSKHAHIPGDDWSPATAEITTYEAAMPDLPFSNRYLEFVAGAESRTPLVSTCPPEDEVFEHATWIDFDPNAYTHVHIHPCRPFSGACPGVRDYTENGQSRVFMPEPDTKDDVGSWRCRLFDGTYGPDVRETLFNDLLYDPPL